MDDREFKQLLLANLAKIESKQDDLNDKLEVVGKTQALQGKDIESMMRELPEIKEDLRQHKEGNIQNRTRIAHIEKLNMDQDQLINKTLETYQKEVKPVVDHVLWLQALPKKISSSIVTASKIMAAVVVILGSAGTLLAYFTGFIGK